MMANFGPGNLCPFNRSWATPVWGSQNCTPPSADPESSQSPCCVNATLVTVSLWPSYVRTHSPLGTFPGTKRVGVFNSHILIVLSQDPDMSLSPKGANAILYMLPV